MGDTGAASTRFVADPLPRSDHHCVEPGPDGCSRLMPQKSCGVMEIARDDPGFNSMSEQD